MKDERGKKRLRLLLLICSSLIYLSLISPSHASPLLADLSNYVITMDSSYNGTRMFVFGARGDTGDVVVLVRGPAKNYIVRKKTQIAGLWVNTERVRYYGVPSFYALSSSKPMKDLPYGALFRQLGIGENALLGSSANRDFANAFIGEQRERHLYSANLTPISFMGETLFKTSIDFPDNIPPGMYNAEVYLVRENTVVGTQVIPIEVTKVGLDAFIYNYAHRHPFYYGIAAVLLALSAGWFAGRLFQKI